MRAGEKTQRQEEAGPKSEGVGPRREAWGPARMRRRLAHTELAAVSEVRRALRELLRHRWRAEPAEAAELLLSELVTNALIHTRHGAVVTASVGPAGLRVEVRDFGPLPSPSYVPDADDGTHGRGLILVRSLADAWGIDARALGKVVWFELDGERP